MGLRITFSLQSLSGRGRAVLPGDGLVHRQSFRPETSSPQSVNDASREFAWGQLIIHYEILINWRRGVVLVAIRPTLPVATSKEYPFG